MIFERLIYISSLYGSLDETTLFLITRAKQIKDKDMRSKIYYKIANIYELTGRIFEAGKYYEKSSYMYDSINEEKLLNSLYMLYEIGYYENVLKKISSLVIHNEEIMNNFNILKYLCLRTLNKNSEAKIVLKGIDQSNSYIKIDNYFQKDSMYERILRDKIELKNLTNYVNVLPVEMSLSNNNTMIKEEVVIGRYEKLPGGVVNILEQLEYNWQFKGNILSIKVKNRSKALDILKKAGINIED